MRSDDDLGAIGFARQTHIDDLRGNIAQSDNGNRFFRKPRYSRSFCAFGINGEAAWTVQSKLVRDRVQG
jgi:hypothetical protein